MIYNPIENSIIGGQNQSNTNSSFLNSFEKIVAMKYANAQANNLDTIAGLNTANTEKIKLENRKNKIDVDILEKNRKLYAAGIGQQIEDLFKDAEIKGGFVNPYELQNIPNTTLNNQPNNQQNVQQNNNIFTNLFDRLLNLLRKPQDDTVNSPTKIYYDPGNDYYRPQ